MWGEVWGYVKVWESVWGEWEMCWGVGGDESRGMRSLGGGVGKCVGVWGR